jgi:hypothetical protein
MLCRVVSPSLASIHVDFHMQFSLIYHILLSIFCCSNYMNIIMLMFRVALQSFLLFVQILFQQIIQCIMAVIPLEMVEYIVVELCDMTHYGERVEAK